MLYGVGRSPLAHRPSSQTHKKTNEKEEERTRKREKGTADKSTVFLNPKNIRSKSQKHASVQYRENKKENINTARRWRSNMSWFIRIVLKVLISRPNHNSWFRILLCLFFKQEIFLVDCLEAIVSLIKTNFTEEGPTHEKRRIKYTVMFIFPLSALIYCEP